MAQYSSAFRMDIQVLVNRLPELQRQLPEVVYEIIRRGANDTARTIREDAPKDTGAMAASVYVATKKGSTYNFSVARAKALRPEWEVYNDNPGRPDENSVVLGVAIGYAGFVEYGHHSRAGNWVPAQPFFFRNVSIGIQMIIEELSELEKYLT